MNEAEMGQHLIVTMFQVFVILATIVLCVAGLLAVRAFWRRWVLRVLSGSTGAVCQEKACAQGRQPPGGT